MEALKLQRKFTRESFTKCNNTIIEELNKSEPDPKIIKVSMITLERLSSDLNKLDGQIVTLVVQEGDEKGYEEEYTHTESYKEKFDRARYNVGEYFSNSEEKHKENTEDCSSSAARKRKLKQSKIELQKFGGDIKDWLSFWNQFQKIHEDEKIGNKDKFQYLTEAVTSDSRAKEIINSFPPTAENYEKVITVLKNSFSEEVLAESYVRELIGLVIRNTSSKGTINIAQLYSKLKSHLSALESIGVVQDKYAAMLFPLVVSCIPVEMVRAWNRSSFHKQEQIEAADAPICYESKLQQLLSFLECEVEVEEKISMAKYGCKVDENLPQHKNKRLVEADEVSKKLELILSELNFGGNNPKAINEKSKSRGRRGLRKYTKWKKISTWLMLLLLGVD